MFGKKKETATATVTLQVSGMMCANCASHVEKALTALAGVKSAKVDLAAGSVTVTATADVRREDMIAAVVAAGYQAQ